MNTQYENLLRAVLETGTPKTDRTGTGTLSVTGAQLRYDLTDSFPLITSKRVHFKSVAAELLWMLSGSSNVAGLHEHGVTIWDEWADEDGELGPVYGVQWRSWPLPNGSRVDQIAQLIRGLKDDPDSRRHVVSAWNVADLPAMALAPCHAFFQFVHQNGALDCVVTQRSADLFLGVPFNIASYALLTHMVAAQTGLTPGTLVWNGGDCHIYKNHVDQVHQQINRDPRPFPTLTLDPAESIDDYTLGHIHLNDYFPHPSIPAPVAV